MTFNLEIEIAKKLIATKVIDKLFHRVELVADEEGVKFPAYPVGSDLHYIGPDDTVGRFAYMRQTGETRFVPDRKNRISSCTIAYSAATPYRIVVFQANTDSGSVNTVEGVVARMLPIGNITGVKITKVETDKTKILKAETNSTDSVLFPSDADILYIAVDITISGVITKKGDSCFTDCKPIQNPICQ